MPRGRPKKQANPETKPAPAKAGSNVTPEAIAGFLADLQKADLAVDEANAIRKVATAARKVVLKRAKSSGCNPAQLVAALNAKRREPEEVKSDLQDSVRYLKIAVPSVFSEDLFADLNLEPPNAKARAQAKEADAEAEGYHAGRQGVPMEDCAYPPGSELFVLWRDGWDRGQRALAMTLPTGATMASQRRKLEPEAPFEDAAE